MISDNFFLETEDNWISQVIKACKVFQSWDTTIKKDDEINNHSEYLDAYAALEVYLLSNGFTFNQLSIGSDFTSNIALIQQFVRELIETLEPKYNEQIALNIITTSRNKYRQKLDIGFLYRFSDGDISRIQQLLNELRDLISTSTDFDANHKERLLNRLESLQKEVHKKMSSLDKFWGLVGDAGVVLGKFGKDAKPFIDRIREITQIIWSIQARAEELPSNTQLPELVEKINK
jgi:hypothetical protein